MRKIQKNRISATFILTLLCAAIFLVLTPENVSATDETYSDECGLFCGVMVNVGVVMLHIAGFFTWLGGIILAFAINEFVLNMSNWVSGSATNSTFGNMSGAINSGWETIRDVCNIAFIFGFVYIGIRTILDYGSANTKRFLANLIIAALLINFSLFFTKVIIDVANVLAVEAYEVMAPKDEDTGAIQNLSDAFMNKMGLNTIYNAGEENMTTMLENGGVAFFFGAFVTLLVAGFVFFAAGIMIITRFAALVLIMVFSPVFFAGLVFEQTKGPVKNFFRKFLGYAFFAPVFILLLLVSYRIIEGANFEPEAFQESFNNGDANILAVFFLIILFLIISLVAAQKLAGKAGDVSVKAAQRAHRVMGRATAGATAAAARSTIGRYADKKANDKDLKDRASRSWLARQQFKLANYGASASYDPRRVGGVGKKLGVGEGKKGGYAQRVKDAEKQEEGFTKKLGTVGDDDTRVAARKNEVESIEQQIREKKRQREGTSGEEKARITGDINALEDKLKTARQNVEQEKNRRVMGTTFTDPKQNQAEVDGLEKNIKEDKKRLGEALQKYNEAKEKQERERAAKEVEAIRTSLKENQEAHKDATQWGKGGYADVIEGRGWFSSTAQRRNRGINRTVAKTIKKEYEKKVKKDKQDKSTDAIVSAVKDTKKDDDA